MNMSTKLNFAKPCVPADSRTKGLVYMGPQTIRDGQEIKDDCCYLFLLGAKREFVYVNSYGHGKGEDGIYKQMVVQTPEPRQGKRDSVKSDTDPKVLLIHDIVTDMSIDVTQGNAEVDAVRETVENLLKLVQDYAGKTVQPLHDIRADIKQLRDFVDQRSRYAEKLLGELSDRVQQYEASPIKA